MKTPPCVRSAPCDKYDTRGNSINDGKRPITYDLANMPKSMTAGGGGGGAPYTDSYDGNGKRVLHESHADTINSVSNLSRQLVHPENAPTGEKTDYIAAGCKTIARVTNGVATYVYSDHLGSQTMLTNAAGNARWWSS